MKFLPLFCLVALAVAQNKFTKKQKQILRNPCNFCNIVENRISANYTYQYLSMSLTEYIITHRKYKNWPCYGEECKMFPVKPGVS